MPKSIKLTLFIFKFLAFLLFCFPFDSVLADEGESKTSSSGQEPSLYLGWHLGREDLLLQRSQNWRDYFPGQTLQLVQLAFSIRGKFAEVKLAVGVNLIPLKGDLVINSTNYNQTSLNFAQTMGQIAFHSNSFGFFDPYILGKGGIAYFSSTNSLDQLNQGNLGLNFHGNFWGAGLGLDLNLISHQKLGFTIGAEAFTQFPFDWKNQGSTFNQYLLGYSFHVNLGLDPETVLFLMFIRAIGRK